MVNLSKNLTARRLPRELQPEEKLRAMVWDTDEDGSRTMVDFFDGSQGGVIGFVNDNRVGYAQRGLVVTLSTISVYS